MYRAVVVDDSATVRTLLTGILQSDPEIQVIGTARDGDEAVRMVQEHRGEYPSLWAAVDLIAPKIGCVPQTMLTRV